MIGGLMKTTSLYAVAAAAGIFMGGFALTPAQAADLGGDCCADLEERVAELEATTVRKGNTKVSLKLSGQINQAILWWDDGFDSDQYVGDNAVSGSRLKFGGSGKINSEWEAGFYLELDYRQTKLESTSQLTDDGGSLNTGGDTNASDIMWYIKSKTLGRLAVGRYDGANDNIVAISLGGVDAVADAGFNDWSEGFLIRLSAGGGFVNGVTWGGLYSGEVGEGDEAQSVRYDSPTIAGFTASASWGQNDHWGVALRYAGEWAALGGLRIAGGIGYGQNDDALAVGTRDEIGGSISVLHVPTGLFLTFAAGQDDDPSKVSTGGASFSADESAYYFQGGINKKFFALGATRIYGEYYKSEDKALTNCTTIDILDADAVACGVAALGSGEYATTGVKGWGVGIVQAIDNSAIELYASYRRFETNIDIFDDAGASVAQNATEDLDVVMTGARIKF